MSKKSRKVKAKYRAQPSVRVGQTEQQTPKTKVAEYKSSHPTIGITSQSWQDQYKYIIPELIRISIIAGIFFIILIILSFILK